jgi:hypothetical protein
MRTHNSRNNTRGLDASQKSGWGKRAVAFGARSKVREPRFCGVKWRDVSKPWICRRRSNHGEAGNA